jgi:hypothetical protein
VWWSVGGRDGSGGTGDRRPAVRPVLQDPTTPTPQPLTGITQHRFSHHPLSFFRLSIVTRRSQAILNLFKKLKKLRGVFFRLNLIDMININEFKNLQL